MRHAPREVPLTTGPCDYLLLVDRKPLGVIEAKKVGTTLSAVADQSARYANSLPDFLAHGLTGLDLKGTDETRRSCDG